MVEGQPVLLLKREFTNAIERTLWRTVAFTGNGEHVCAAVSTSNEHIVYIWTRDWGNLEAVLQGEWMNILPAAAAMAKSLNKEQIAVQCKVAKWPSPA